MCVNQCIFQRINNKENEISDENYARLTWIKENPLFDVSYRKGKCKKPRKL